MRHTPMNTRALGVLMLLFGGIVARISLTGEYVRYVKPGLLPLLIAAAVALIAVGGVTLWYDLRSSGTQPPRHSGSTPPAGPSAPAADDGHHHHEPGVG